MKLTEVQNKTKAFKDKDAMKIICNLGKLTIGDDFYRTGNVTVRGIKTSGGENYLKLEYPILYLKYKGDINNIYKNYDDTEVGKFYVSIRNNYKGYKFEINNLNDEFLDKCISLLSNPKIKNCEVTEVEEKVFNNGTTIYIKNKSCTIQKLWIELKRFYKNKKAYWDDSTDTCLEFKDMADFSQPDKDEDTYDVINNKGFYLKILSDMKKDTGHGFLVELEDVNQICAIGNHLGVAMYNFFVVGGEEREGISRRVITYKQGQQYCTTMFRNNGENLSLIT